MAELLAAERLGLEERELPAVERFAQLRVVVGGAEPDAQVAATEARNGSSRVASPGGAVAAIGRTGRIP